MAGDFKNAFSDYYNAGKKVHKEDKILLNYLMSAMMYMKPISGLEKIEGEEKPYIFQDVWMALYSNGAFSKQSKVNAIWE